MIGMWIIPFLISLKFLHVRFLIIWTIFTFITVWIARKSIRVPIERSTPRLLYKWFLLVHKISYVLGIVGYVGLMLTFLGFNFLFFVSPTAALDTSFMLMFYGVYYGVLGRDIAESCSDRMASKIGVIICLISFIIFLFSSPNIIFSLLKYYTETGMPQRTLETNTCAICANLIMILNNDEALIESTFSLPCGHM